LYLFFSSCVCRSRDYRDLHSFPTRRSSDLHQGYYWVYHSPLDRIVLFDYNPSRGGHVPGSMLDSFKGYLQTDGYAAYEKYGRKKDRKSTRLNSSHVKISYAVFCLKKKKKIL